MVTCSGDRDWYQLVPSRRAASSRSLVQHWLGFQSLKVSTEQTAFKLCLHQTFREFYIVRFTDSMDGTSNKQQLSEEKGGVLKLIAGIFP